MARYEQLPIYKQALDLTVYFEKTVRSFSRCNKCTLGGELRAVSRGILKLIIKANSSREKLLVLYELRERLEELKVLIRIAKEAEAFKGFKSFQHAIEGTVSVSKQNGKWIKSLSKRSEKA